MHIIVLYPQHTHSVWRRNDWNAASRHQNDRDDYSTFSLVFLPVHWKHAIYFNRRFHVAVAVAVEHDRLGARGPRDPVNADRLVSRAPPRAAAADVRAPLPRRSRLRARRVQAPSRFADPCRYR